MSRSLDSENILVVGPPAAHNESRLHAQPTQSERRPAAWPYLQLVKTKRASLPRQQAFVRGFAQAAEHGPQRVLLADKGTKTNKQNSLVIFPLLDEKMKEKEKENIAKVEMDQGRGKRKRSEGKGVSATRPEQGKHRRTSSEVDVDGTSPINLHFSSHLAIFR